MKDKRSNVSKPRLPGNDSRQQLHHGVSPTTASSQRLLDDEADHGDAPDRSVSSRWQVALAQYGYA